jgi:hypothetical protein
MTQNKHEYLLVLRCRLTKFIIIIPIKNKEAETVREKLKEQFLTFGFPRKLVTDRGREFSIKKLGALLKEKRSDAQHKRISTANPRSNGEAENAMRYIKDILVYYTGKYQDDWDKNIKEVQYIMNNYVSEATGYSPNFLMFGRELPYPDDDYSQRHNRTFNIREFREMMEIIWNEATATINGSNVDKYNKYINNPPKAPLQFTPYKVDTFAFVKRIPRQSYKTKKEEEEYVNSRKLQHRYSGPYLILQKHSDVSYVLDIHGKRRTFHAINMKPA